VNQEEPAVVPGSPRPVTVNLVSRARDGDQDAWDKIVRRYARLIWAICHEHGLDQDDTNYVAEAVWLGLLRQLYDQPEPVLPQWIARFTKEVCRQVLGGAGPYARQAALNRRARVRASATGFSVRSLTGLAAFLAGREGPALLYESDGHLAGESGHDPLTWAKVKEAAGFVVAGVRYRGQDWADAAWKPADAVLRSRTLSNLLAAVPTIVVAVEVLTHKGTMTLLTSLGAIFGTWTFLAGLIKAGRWYRDVEPPEPKARQAKKGDRGT